MLLEEIGYVVEAVCIFGRTTAVVRLHNSWYAHAQQVMCMRSSTVVHQHPDLWHTLLRDAWRSCAAIYACWSLESVKSGEEWVKSCCKLFTPLNADKYRGSRRFGEECRVKSRVSFMPIVLSRMQSILIYFAIFLENHLLFQIILVSLQLIWAAFGNDLAWLLLNAVWFHH